MQKNNFIHFFNFKNDDEQENCIFYLKMKGVYFHKKIMEHLGFDFSKENAKIDWELVSATLHYDKKIRNKTYIYLATLEEYIRAYISDKYQDDPFQNFWQNGKTKRACVKNRIEKGEKVSDVLESIEFGDLLNQVKKMPIPDLEKMFTDTKDIIRNLNRVRELRNAVSHHVFLLGYDSKPHASNNDKKNKLEESLKNLRELLPSEFRYGKNGQGGITKDINSCIYNLKKANHPKNIKQKLAIRDLDEIHM